MSSIILSIEDEEIIKKLYKYSKDRDLTVEELIVGDKDTGLRRFTITESKSVPGYDEYVKYSMDVGDITNDTALLYVLGLFYDVAVVRNKEYFYFSDGVTPFYVKKSNLEIYQRNFHSLINQRLVSNNPMIVAVLKDNIVKQYKKYNMWYTDYRNNTDEIEKQLANLIKEGYFLNENPNWKDKIQRFQFEELPSHPGIIRGPELMGYRLTKDVLTGEYITVKTNYKLDRRTLAGCILATVQEIGKIACSELMKIKVNPDSITLRAHDYDSLKRILENTDIIARNSIAYDVENIDEGIQTRIGLLKLGYKSLLLSDQNGYYVVAYDYKGGQIEKEEDYPHQEDLEFLASSLLNYKTHGKNYSHVGIYSIPGILPGILKNIPTLLNG
jgi:hypothetical protein